MIIGQLSLRLPTIKRPPKCAISSHSTATDVARFVGGSDCRADCRNVHRSCPPKCPFRHHKLSPKAFQRIWHYIQLASQTTSNHTSPGSPHATSSTPRSSSLASRMAAATNGLQNQRFPAQMARKHLREACVLIGLTAVRCYGRLEWTNSHFWFCLVLWRCALFINESQFLLYMV